jgi:hypothetical protein
MGAAEHCKENLCVTVKYGVFRRDGAGERFFVGLHPCKAGALLLEPHLQSIFGLIILENLLNYFPGLALNPQSS